MGNEYLLPLLLACLMLILIQLLISLLRRPADVSAKLTELELIVQDAFRQQRQETDQQLRANREEMAGGLSRAAQSQERQFDHFRQSVDQFGQRQEERLDRMSDMLYLAVKDMRIELTSRLEKLQNDNNEQLEKMRETVDEKLNRTLEERLGRSFRLVQESLEKVQLGLGEMQVLASGVGDLKRVLSNVKTRGTLGEIQLGNILEQILTREQYGVNVATVPESSNHVEFAVRFPGPDNSEEPVWLPIDSKFPMDRYEQLLAAYEAGDPELIESAHKELVRTVKLMARDIREKYIAPPYTTEFGVLFLPVEGLYAEIARHPGILEELQREYRILLAGPSNLAAFLNSLQMGFRSIAIEKRSSEVWKILGQVKTEFGKFGEVLDRVQKQLSAASNTIEKAGVRTRAIERKLRDVESLPSGEENDDQLPESNPGE